jgi:CheY-like chemotaxis protein
MRSGEINEPDLVDPAPNAGAEKFRVSSGMRPIHPRSSNAEKPVMARILVADDDPQVLEFLRAALAKVGHDVVAVSDGREVDRIHRDCPVDLVVTDLIMPNRDGLQTIMELRNQFPKLPIIAISGGGSLGSAAGHDWLEIASGLGAQIVEKPFGTACLYKAVDSALAPESMDH